MVLGMSVPITFFALLFLTYSLSKNIQSITKPYLVILGIYIIYISIIMIIFLIFRLPLILKNIYYYLAIIISSLIMSQTIIAISLFLSQRKYPFLLSFMIIPFCVILLYVSFYISYRIQEPQKIESFDYISDIDERFNDPDYAEIIYYDEEENIIIIEEDKYPAEYIDNPESVNGISRYLLYFEELINPSSQIIQNYVITEDKPISIVGPLKLLLWFILINLFNKKYNYLNKEKEISII